MPDSMSPAGGPNTTMSRKAQPDEKKLDPAAIDALLKESGTDPAQGLAADEAARRLEKFGRNELAEKHQSLLLRLFRFFWGPIPWMIEIAAILSAALGHWPDLAIILVMLAVNAVVGFWQDYKADNAIQLLKKRLAARARVLRDGSWQDIDAAGLVPGDIVRVKMGGIVPADMTIVKDDYLSVDQSALTGESLPVDRGMGETLFSGSIARLGEATGVVTETGPRSFFGRTASLVQKAKGVSHFQRAVLRIGNFLILVTAALVAFTVIIALYRHDPLFETLQFALILTVASIPVALPAILSVTMAVGAEKLAALRAIVARLVSIEEMAGMDVLCSDKTGTLTKNELTLGDLQPLDGVSADELIEAAALACDPEAPDAIDTAILAGVADKTSLSAFKRVAFHPFDPVSKRAEADLEKDGARLSVAKGAPQVMLDLCEASEEERARVGKMVDEAAAHGLRMIGVARAAKEGDWTLLGLLPLFDPPREDSAATIAELRSLGVDVKMITGDHEAIAREIAAKLDLGSNILVASDLFGADGNGKASQAEKAVLEADGFARVFPQHKFEIVEALQDRGHIVGMTGDGVNDAPALRQADMGVAVSGATDAARAAADLVLTAPGLSVITRAVEEARRIFERMTSYATYRIAETIRVLIFMTLSIALFNFYPVTAVMVVLLALLNDLSIMMIAYDNAPVAPRPVRWDMTRIRIIAGVLGGYGVIASFGVFLIARDYLQLPPDVVQTVVFLKLLVAGHMTIYLTRNEGWLWDRPWPSWKLVVPAELTQLVGTLAAVYGVFMTPIGWKLALMVWGFAFLEFITSSALKVAVYRLFAHGWRRNRRHLERVESHLYR
ncbi:plasma-membrane proton-efflux P-type ATPase [Parvibaculum sp. MBR-TMA-1.3b-4.2]